jgi:hypothetical protein
VVRDCGAAPIACDKDAGELDYILKNVSPTGPEARVTYGHRMSKKIYMRGQLRFGLLLGILPRLQKGIFDGVGLKK